MVPLLWFLLSLLCTSSALSSFKSQHALRNLHKGMRNIQRISAAGDYRFPEIIEEKPFAAAVANEDSCVWVEKMHRCIPGMNTTRSILDKTNRTLAEAAYSTIFCQSIEEEAICQAAEHCTWYQYYAACDFVSYFSTYPESPCITVAPVFFSADVNQAKCESKGETSESCSNDPNCYFDEDQHRCNFNIFKVITGVSFDELEEANEFIAEASASAGSQFYSAFDLSKGFMDWQSVLTWQPDVECPEEVSEKVCDYITQIVVSSIPTIMYCSNKYATKTGCDRDPLCIFSIEDFGCTAKSEVIEEFVSSAFEVLIADVESSGDKEYVSSLLTCAGTSMEACEKEEKCYWSTVDDLCFVSNEILYSYFFEQAGGYVDDPVCSGMEQYVLSGTGDIRDKEKCLENYEWIWSDEYGCVVSGYVLGRAALKGDEESEAEWEDVHTACKAFTDKESCEGGALDAIYVT